MSASSAHLVDRGLLPFGGLLAGSLRLDGEELPLMQPMKSSVGFPIPFCTGMW